MIREGGCQCGAVRFKADGEPANVWLCHCRQCQQTFSAPFNARAFYLGPQVATSGETVQYATSERLSRVSCAKCGTRVWTVRSDGYGYGLPLAAFDDPEAFTPTDHIFITEKAAWLKLDDGLPQHAMRPRQ